MDGFLCRRDGWRVKGRNDSGAALLEVDWCCGRWDVVGGGGWGVRACVGDEELVRDGGKERWDTWLCSCRGNGGLCVGVGAVGSRMLWW